MGENVREICKVKLEQRSGLQNFFFFKVDHFLKSLLNLLQYSFCIML